MNLLRFLLGQESISYIINEDMQINEEEFSSLNPLPQDFYYLLIERHGCRDKRQKIFSNIIKQFRSSANLPTLFKTLTIIFSKVTKTKYDNQILQVLQNLETPNFDQSPAIADKWVKELVICCKSYLMRLPSLSQMMHRALDKENAKSDYSILLADLYLILNTFSLLFPSLTIALNTIGRYFMKNNPFFYQFYNAIRQHVILGYSYMQFIVNKFIKQFKSVEIHSLQILMRTLPEIELMCDKIEEILVNKHFKGSPPLIKLYLKEDRIQEICYYIRSYGEALKSKEIIQTAEDEGFGYNNF